MGFFSPSSSYHEVPGLSQFLSPLQGFQPGLGKSGRVAKNLLGDLQSGNYEGLAGSFLSPIKDQFAVNQRENDRSLNMGANALYQGSQPGLMAAIGNEGRLKNQEGLGMSLASAIPGLYGQASNAFQSAYNTKQGLTLDAMRAALEGKIGGNKLVTNPSMWSSITGGLKDLMQGAGSLAGGFGMGGSGGGGCWIAEAVYGIDDPRTHFLRWWLNTVWAHESIVGFIFMALYLRIGQRVARVVKRNNLVRWVARFVFDGLLTKATGKL